MVATVVDGAFFAPSSNGIPIPDGTSFNATIPKLLTGDEFVHALEVTETVVEAAATTIVTTQIIIYLVMAFSLKSMWNLMNVIQVLAYMRFYTSWPAFMMEIF